METFSAVYGVETFMAVYNVETFIAVYGVETFLRCREFRCKELLLGFKLFTVAGYVRSLKFYPFGHIAIQSEIV